MVGIPKLSGTFEVYYSDNVKMATITLTSDKANGVVTRYDTKGDILYTANLTDGLLNGVLTLMRNGEVYIRSIYESNKPTLLTVDGNINMTIPLPKDGNDELEVKLVKNDNNMLVFTHMGNKIRNIKSYNNKGLKTSDIPLNASEKIHGTIYHDDNNGIKVSYTAIDGMKQTGIITDNELNRTLPVTYTAGVVTMVGKEY